MRLLGEELAVAGRDRGGALPRLEFRFVDAVGAGAEFDAARAAGLTDGELVEIIAVVALNIFTNVLGKATRVEIDFPKVELMAGKREALA